MNESQVSASQSMISPARQQAQLKHLQGIADKIREENLKVESYMRHTVKHALLAGKLLCEVKRLVGHGHWLTWFHAQQFSFGEVTAQRYMRLYRRWPEIQTRIGETGNPSSLTDLTFNDALDVLAKHDSAETEPKPRKSAKLKAGRPTLDTQSECDKTNQSGQALIVQSSRPVVLPNQFDISADWLTPQTIIEAVVRVLGTIDLDPAADLQTSVPAVRHYTPSEDGLHPKNSWQGRVYLNPPSEFGLLEQFVVRLESEFNAGNVVEAILLTPSQTNAKWYQRMRNLPRVLIAQIDETSGLPLSGALTAFYLGSRQSEFFEAFRQLGDGYVPYRHNCGGEN